MHSPTNLPVWKQAPFLRLLVPLISGILLQWYLHFPIASMLAGGIGALSVYCQFMALSRGRRFWWRFVQGICLNLLLISVGSLLTFQSDPRHRERWYGNIYHPGDQLVVRLDEPLIEKAHSFKADGCVEAVIHGDSVIKSQGKILLYFNKDSTANKDSTTVGHLRYGDQLVFQKAIQPIRNSGNPGAFDYERYAAFQQVFHNVFLKEKDWQLLDEKKINPLRWFIFLTRDKILSILRENIDGKDELGISQALLIGYTNDLDRDLVQAYSNTGVVHIIAISGMHLALIYLLLVKLFSLVPGVNRSRWMQVLLILACLWLFSLLTGASASVLRSAVMFTFVAAGTGLKKKASVYNSLAASAFVLLCYNPYFLWDVGFQLSYLALLSIVLFQRPISAWCYVKNKWLRMVWELAAVSLAAQVLTFPVCIYYFHQFPNFFLLTNMVAVPLSTLILYVEIGLLLFYRVPFLGGLIGKAVAWLVMLMNQSILCMDRLPYSVWQGISASVVTTLLLYGLVFCMAGWLLNKNRALFRLALVFGLLFVAAGADENWQRFRQQKMIVYNISRRQAVDFVEGNDYHFMGDSLLLNDALQQNFNLRPARIAFQLNHPKTIMPSLFQQGKFFQFQGKTGLLIDSSLVFQPAAKKLSIDFIILSKSPKIKMAQLAATFDCHLFIFDASNSLWKIEKWRKECEELHLRSYSVPAEGAFVLDINQ